MQWTRAAAVLLAFALAPVAAPAAECVVLLHGLARTERSMVPLADRLAEAGYLAVNVGYDSRAARIETLASSAVDAGLRGCREAVGGAALARVHFVTHSMGGILVRAAFVEDRPDELGRIVMLAPPNRGSEIVDELGDLALFEWINGPAGAQLGTGPEDVPQQLGAVDFPVGVIAGTRSLNPWLSSYLDGPDDGKVSVARARVAGMADFIEVEATHTFIMRNAEALRQTIHFLRHGAFDAGAAAP